MESRLKEEREEKNGRERLIEVGAIFEKYFEIERTEEAEKIAISLKKYVTNNKDKILNLTKEQLEEANKKSKELKREEIAVK